MLRKRESGAVSLFVVVFAMLLITVVTLSFLRLMIKDQQQAISNDLSQSAYDSSLAGVEDAKRALIYYRTVCNSGDAGACAIVRNTINSTSCNAGLKDVVPNVTGSEVQVQQQQSSTDAALNQAYTCVLMQLDTPDYLGTLSPNSSRIIPLIGVGSFSSIKVEWFTTDDLGAPGSSINLERRPPDQDAGSTNNSIYPLYSQSSWPQSRPPMLRTQLMQFGSTVTASDFDNGQNGNSNANTLFLYPTGTTGTASSTVNTWDFTRDARKTATGIPTGTNCTGRLASGGYACSAILNLPTPIGNAGNTPRTAYLRLTSLYKATHFRVSLVGTNFRAVQPSIDSTGRANDQFRRVETRVDLYDTNFPFPEAAVDVSGNLCKNFLVTEESSSFSTECTP